MQSILFVSKDQGVIKERGVKFFEDRKINTLDITIIENDKAVGIGSIREILEKIYLRPIKSTEKGILILSINGVINEAQNALLKVLEEPPPDTTIILGVGSEDEILPTIKSRCKLIKLGEERIIPSVKLDLGKTGQRLKLAQDLSKDKATSLEFIEGAIAGLRENILVSGQAGKIEKNDIQNVQKLINYYSVIKNTNTNLRLTLENLLLSL